MDIAHRISAISYSRESSTQDIRQAFDNSSDVASTAGHTIVEDQLTSQAPSLLGSVRCVKVPCCDVEAFARGGYDCHFE